MHDLSLREIAAWDQFTPTGLAPKKLKAFESRQGALRAVAAGSTLAAAASRYRVPVKTLSETIRKAPSIAPDGRPWGWRACIPNRARQPSTAVPDEFPVAAGPGAFSTFLRKAPEFQDQLVNYTGPLPGRNAPTPKFERYFKTLRAWIRGNVPIERYPANDKTFARRSILAFIHKQREGELFIDDEFVVEDANDAGQLNEIFALQLGDWVQYDGHSLDCKFQVEGEDGDGNPYLQQIIRTWLLVGYFALLRLCSSWKLSFALNYNGTDFNEVCANSLREWTPRELVAPTMAYLPGSGVGTAHAIGVVVTGAITSVDNAKAHRLNVNRQRMALEMRGVIHFGKCHVPETRGHLEACNKRIEECIIRQLPGGYRPPGENSATSAPTNTLAPDSYPVEPNAFDDLMDVTISAANVTALDAFQSRSPTQVLQSFFAAGGWLFSTSDHDDRGNEMSTLSLTVTIRGTRKTKRQPYVRFAHARYRSVALRNRWDLVGKTYAATVNIQDGRFLRLYDEEGELFVALRARRPWGRSPHSLALRRLIHRQSRRGRFEIQGVQDAVLAYLIYLQGRFQSSREAATTAVQYRREFDAAAREAEERKASPSFTWAAPSSQLPDVFVPITGRVSVSKK